MTMDPSDFMGGTYYDVLGVPFDADEDDISQAYTMRAAMAMQNGDVESLMELREAFDVLGDPEAREHYNDELDDILGGMDDDDGEEDFESNFMEALRASMGGGAPPRGGSSGGRKASGGASASASASSSSTSKKNKKKKNKNKNKSAAAGASSSSSSAAATASSPSGASSAAAAAARASSTRNLPKGDDMMTEFTVSLEELYNGAERRPRITRNTTCTECNGLGGKKGATVICIACRGRGAQTGYMHIGMGMVQEVRQICEECDGEGECIPEAHRCTSCLGKKKKEEEVFVDVRIDAGTMHGSKITVAGESHRSATHRPGDVVFIVREADHDSFKRQGRDLWVNRTVSITEALCGCRFEVVHLDGRSLIVTSPAGQVIRPGTVMTIKNQGFPIKGTSRFGDLHVRFNIDYSFHAMPDDQMKALQSLLPSSASNVAEGGDYEEVFLHQAEASDFGSRRNIRSQMQHAEDDDDEGHGHGHGGPMGCASQ